MSEMPKILITGAKGQLGRELQLTAPSNVEIIALSHQELDIGVATQVQEVVSTHKPAWIINAAAYNAVDAAETEQRMAFAINAEGPAHLAKAALCNHARFIHVSTDYVFDGRQGQPYVPTDTCRPLNVYGQSKQAGEQKVLDILPSSLIVRSSWIYSSYEKNFVKTILHLLRERNSLPMVFDQVGSPTWAKTLAMALWAAVRENNLSGIYHWSDVGVASKYDFVLAIQEEALHLGLIDRPIPVQPILTRDFPLPAVRPCYSVLDCLQSWHDLNVKPLHWREALKLMLQEFGNYSPCSWKQSEQSSNA